MRATIVIPVLMGLVFVNFFACAAEDVDAIDPHYPQIFSGEQTNQSRTSLDQPTSAQSNNQSSADSNNKLKLLPLTSYDNCQQMPLAQLGYHFHLHTQVDLAEAVGQRKIALMTVFLPKTSFRPNTLPYLKGLQASGWQVVLIVNTEDKAVFQSPKLRAELIEQSGAEVVLFRENLGYDFSGWHDALRIMPYLWTSELLLLTNDSLLGPVNPASMSALQERIEQSSTGEVLYLTESQQTTHHYQSFFIVLKQAARARAETIHFFCSIAPFSRKKDVINFLEFGLSRYWREQKVPVQVLFPICEQMDCANSNPTTSRWQALLEGGFPFFKMEMLRSMNSSDLPGYCHAANMLSALGYDFHVIDADYLERCEPEASSVSAAY